MVNKTSTNDQDDKKLLELVIDVLDEKKGEDIVVLNIQGKSSIADYYVVCTGLVGRHLKSLGEEVEEQAKKKLGEKVYRSEGWQEQEWIILDYGNVIVHIMLPQKRQELLLEELWGK